MSKGKTNEHGKKYIRVIPIEEPYLLMENPLFEHGEQCKYIIPVEGP